jgi:hypothetical protein
MRLFMSYARADKPLAEALVADLHALGHQVFYDRELTGGQRWWDALLDEIQNSDGFVPVLSDNYRNSQACRAEAQWATALGAAILPVQTAPQLPGMYEPAIAETNWVSYDPSSRTALADLSRGINAITRRPLPSPLPPRPPIPLSYLITLDDEIRGAGDLSRQRQLTITSDLRSKLGTRDDAGARELLRALRARPDVTYETANDIDALLADRPVEPPRSRAGAPGPAGASRPRTSSRTRVIAGAAVVVVLAAVVAIVIAVRSGSGSDDAGSGHTQTQSQSPSGSQTVDFASEEINLAQKLPPTVARDGSCGHDTANYEGTRGVRADIVCKPGLREGSDPAASLGELSAVQFTSTSELLAFTAEHYRASVSGHCDGSHGTIPRTGFHNPWAWTNDESHKIGTLYCFTDSSSGPILVWTFDADAVLVQILAKQGRVLTLPQLYHWWLGCSDLV